MPCKLVKKYVSCICKEDKTEIIFPSSSMMLILSVNFCTVMLYNVVFRIVVKTISNNMLQPTNL